MAATARSLHGRPKVGTSRCDAPRQALSSPPPAGPRPKNIRRKPGSADIRTPQRGVPTKTERCNACGQPWTDHPGIAATCTENLRLRLANETLTAENVALKQLIEDAKKVRGQLLLENSVILQEQLTLTRKNLFVKTNHASFRAVVYLSLIPAGKELTLKNLLVELAKIRKLK